MADDAAQAAAQGQDTGAKEKKGSGLLRQVGFVLALLAVVGVECALAAMLLPSPEDVAAAAGISLEEPEPSEEQRTLEELEGQLADDSVETVEKDLGTFHVTTYQVATNTTWSIDFHLYVLVAKEDEQEFDTLYAQTQNRIRESVLVIIRGSEIKEFADAGLGLIKRRILTKVNATLGKPLVRGVVITEFSFFEN